MSGQRDDRDALSANVIRGLTLDAIQTAGVGHPGMPLGMADAATVLWSRFLRHSPSRPDWFDRDRFVLSAGHGAMLLYALLHLSGYALPVEQLRRHRQLDSQTPGHPERGRTPGVETTTGPLGQGFANAVGMALAERLLAATFNRPGAAVIDHRTWCIAGDGDMEEGISHEAASLAGHLKLGKLVCLYDDNRTTIDGPTSISFTEDVLRRFEAYGWRVQRVDGHDLAAVDAAIRAAVSSADRPALIACRTVIGRGSPRYEGTHRAHATPFGAEETRATKAALGLPPDRTFWVPDEVSAHWQASGTRGERLRQGWEERFCAYEAAHPEAARALRAAIEGKLPEGWDAALPSWAPGVSLSTRAASGEVLDAISARIPTLVGGSADLSESNRSRPKGAVDVAAGDFRGRYVRYGIREHAMAAITNGLALHGGLVPYAATYLVFSDYLRPAVRMAAMMRAPVIHVWTHDSVSVGEDGPTHQPVEQLASYRCLPDLLVFRPADAAETAAAWRYALAHRDRPVALMLARQSVPVLPNPVETVTAGVAAGAYVAAEAAGGRPEVILIATGSEVAVAMEARGDLARRGIAARVVSMPCWSLFDAQPPEARARVLPPDVTARVSVEAGVTLGWERYVGSRGAMIGIDRYGMSARGPEVLARLGVTAERVVEEAVSVVGKELT